MKQPSALWKWCVFLLFVATLAVSGAFGSVCGGPCPKDPCNPDVDDYGCPICQPKEPITEATPDAGNSADK